MIVLVGGTGYVGSAYARYFQHRGIPFRILSRSGTDYANPDLLARELKAADARFLINAAGYTGKPNVDACELHKAECLFGNAVLPGRIAEACRRTGVPWGHISSSCIYTGSRRDGSEFTEADFPNFTFRQNNCSFYSGCKALGEEVLQSESNVFIWRLRIPFDHRDGPRNYLSKLMRYPRLLEATNSITQLDEFVAATYACWEKRVPFGIYNVTNPGYITTREVVELIQESGVCRKEFQFFASEDEFMDKAVKTPRSNCIISSAKLASCGIEMTPVRTAISNCLSQWIPEEA